MTTHRRRLFFFLFFIIIISVTIPSSFCDDDQQYSKCNGPLRCGEKEFPDVTYPFFGANKPEYCGRKGFELVCQNDGHYLTMSIANVSYQLLRVYNDTKAITIVQDGLLSGRACPQNFTFPGNETFRVPYPDVRMVTLLTGCSGNTNQVPSRLGFTCGPSNREETYVLDKFGYPDGVSCNRGPLVPMLSSTLASLEGNMTLEYALNQGFNLTYDTNESFCGACEDSGGVCGTDEATGTKFVCYCKDKPHPAACPRNKVPPGIIIVAIGLLTGITAASIAFICYRRCRKPMRARKNTWKGQDVEALLTLKRYSYAEVRKMTEFFAHIVGKGGFGTVYRGKLLDGRLVAVKVLNESKGNGEDFINEVASMSNTSHVNITSLLGFCFEGTKRALIYEFVPNGSLDKYISNRNLSKMEWKTLHEIAVGVARGLEYLHGGCKTRIVHFDIKPQNILLDEHLCPKISDFGLAKLCKKRESVMSLLDTRGTFGYIAPEVFLRNIGRVSHKSDVYSYGMLVLEMVGARKNDNPETSTSDGSSMYFPDWIYKDLERGGNMRLHGDDITEEEKETAEKMILVGLWCIQTNPSDRPPMSEVVKMMEGSFDALHIPPKPLLFCPTEAPQVCSNQTQDDSTSGELSQ